MSKSPRVTLLGLGLAMAAMAALAPCVHAQANTATVAHGAIAPADPITLDQAMADPDWIGPPVEDAWWAWNGASVQYRLRRDGGSIRDTWQQPLAGGAAQRVEATSAASLDGPDAVYDATRTRMAFVRNGDIFVRDLRNGALTQLTRTDAAESRPQFGRDGGLVWRAGNDWFRWTQAGGAMQAAVIKAEKDPAAAPKPDDLRDRQLRLSSTLRDDRDRRDAKAAQDRQWRQADPSAAPPPVYLGDEVEIDDSALSPDGRWMVVVTHAKGADAGQVGKLPKYVTESGYEEFEEVRTRVGRNAPLAQKIWLVDIAAAKASELPVNGLPGIAIDPLADLRKAAGKDALKGDRDVRVETDGDGNGPAIHWSADGGAVALLVRAIDNKDRWLASVDLPRARLQVRHHLHDAAWINWNFNDFGWLADGRTLWLLSEQSGHSQLYLADGGKGRALTSGAWEASAPVLSVDGGSLQFLCNRNWPGDYEVCAVPVGGGDVREITALDGVEGFSASPDGTQLLVHASRSYMPAQLSVVDVASGNARQLTDTRTAAFKARRWIEPRYVQVPSQHGAGTVWGKFYGPATLQPGKKYPVVMFVHGAGYLQNVSARYPNYFREQMFHNLLVQQGYLVLDLDYRASEGYGRDWRTAIYRHMGKPELEDYLDGIDWIVANQQGDRDRIGIYGGSYGGFLTYAALFQQPGVFKAGAALRAVADWSQYNHEYTSNILNTPELDPEAYRVSSPIEYAQGLRDHLLIAHGMIDDNVFFRDSVMMSQKLIELRKANWELAPYPMERHGFTHPDSWFDEYRRIDELFNAVLQPQR